MTPPGCESAAHRSARSGCWRHSRRQTFKRQALMGRGTALFSSEGFADPYYASDEPNPGTGKMGKEQKSNREKKKPKQDKSAKAAAPGSAYAQAFKTKK